jgi:hypothetical protein
MSRGRDDCKMLGITSRRSLFSLNLKVRGVPAALAAKKA